MNIKESLILIFLVTAVPFKMVTQTTAMSYNLRYENSKDRKNNWKHRKEEVSKMLNYYSPDIIGVQEALSSQVKHLDSTLINYSYVSASKNKNESKGEYAAIFFNTKKIKLLNSETFWLSKTPEKASIGWDAAMKRIVTYGEFLNNETKEKIHVFNSHFDHRGKLARIKSAELITQIIIDKKILHEKVIVMGDFNCEPNSKPITTFKTILKDSYESSKAKPYGPVGTFNKFNKNSELKKRIDYIMTRNIEVLQYTNIDDRRENNYYLSDHLPVFISFE